MENFGVLNLATAMYLSQQKMANQIANFNRQRPVETETVKTPLSFGMDTILGKSEPKREAPSPVYPTSIPSPTASPPATVGFPVLGFPQPLSIFNQGIHPGLMGMRAAPHGLGTIPFSQSRQGPITILPKSKRNRTVFTNEQLEKLEIVFERSKYLVGTERSQLAAELGLNETQVKVWFQNRRIKLRKQTKCETKADSCHDSSNASSESESESNSETSQLTC